MIEVPRPVLKGKKALVVGIANEHSIAYGCARAFRELGADLAITYLSEKAKVHVQPLAEKLEAQILAPLDVGAPGELEALFERIGREWGRLDILVHSIAWAPKADLQTALLDCTADGCSTKLRSGRRSASWWTSPMSASPARISRRHTRVGSRAVRSTSTAA